jgi:hypothetical protein
VPLGSLAAWVAGLALVVIGVMRANAAWSRLAALDQLADNARRYAGWRGGRATEPAETTGADVMRALLRRRLYTWAAVALTGGVLILAGFVIR